MSKKDVIKPGHFKLAGRMRPGKDTVPEDYKQDFAQEEAREEEFAKRELPLPGMKSRRRAAAQANAGNPSKATEPRG